MKPITFDKVCYRIDGQPTYLYCGEFHYFRVPKRDWRRRMQLFKEAGGNCIATYIPWLLHEPKEGEFTFHSDDGVLDLEGFFRTAQEAGLYVLARPGPYQYSELANAGLPGWLCGDYPQLMARDLKGKTLSPYSISYVHPLLLEKARNWFAQVCPIIARNLVTRGGCVPMVQLDNELTGIHIWYGSVDCNEQAMGFGQEDGRYARFLRGRYGDLAGLNASYGTAWKGFADARPVDDPARYDPPELRRVKDYFDFYLGTIAEYVQALAGMAREFGIDVPFVHNSANPVMNALFTDTVKAMCNAGEPGSGGAAVNPQSPIRNPQSQFLLGSDHYYNLEGQNNPTPEYAVKVFYSHEMLRLMGFPPTVFEMPSGAVFDFPPALVEDHRACYWANLAYGMKGHNYYIYTGGPNPPGSGTTTDLYDYNAPVSADGEIRPIYQVQKDLGDFLAKHHWLMEARREHDLRVALDWEHSRASYYWKKRGEATLSGSEAWDLLRKGLLTTAFSASLSPVLVDLGQDDWLGDTATPVAFVCSSSMARSAQERIVRFLRGGGKALLLPILPTLDEGFGPCTVLSDFLGSPTLGARGKGEVRVSIGRPGTIVYGGGVYFTDNLPAGAEVVGQDENSGRPIAWLKTTEGGGQALVLGYRWSHARHEHERMLTHVLKPLGVRQRVVCSNPYLWTSLRTAGKRSMLFVINFFTGTLEAEVSCRPEWSKEPIDLGVQEVGPMSVKTIVVE